MSKKNKKQSIGWEVINVIIIYLIAIVCIFCIFQAIDSSANLETKQSIPNNSSESNP